MTTKVWNTNHRPERVKPAFDASLERLQVDYLDLYLIHTPFTYQGRSAYTVSIMEFRNGKVVHETQYFADPFEAPAWRSQWVQPVG